MKLVLLGKPLSGKGTQAALLSKALDISVLSLGALFRREVEKKSVLGKKVEKYMKKGTLVPHSVIDVHCSNRLIQKRIMARRSCPKCGKIYGLDVHPPK